jgi:16S rRNA G527 N7-methylase RsmG
MAPLYKASTVNSNNIHMLLETEASRAGLSIEQETSERLLRYLNLLEHWGTRINLTSRLELSYIIQHHLIDPFMLAVQIDTLLAIKVCDRTNRSTVQAHIPQSVADEQPSQQEWRDGVSDRVILSQNLTCADIGSGAGLLGLVLACLRPTLQMVLVEPRKKRCSFLRAAIHELSLSAQVCEKRLQEADLAKQDLLFSRATFKPVEWLSMATPHLTQGGIVFCLLSHGTPIPTHPELTLAREFRYTLADGAKRRIVSFTISVSRETKT